MKRLVFLDGLRGWGALFVLLYHVFCSGLSTSDFARFYLARTVPFSGLLAVCIFFMVSGFSLSIGYVTSGDRRVVYRLAVGRYFRLVIPIFAACSVVHLAMVTGLLSEASARMPPFGGAAAFEPKLAHLLRFSLFDVFFSYVPTLSYIGPLWTMSIEMFGSALVFVALVVFGPARPRTLYFVVSAMLVYWFAGPLYALFIAGMLLAAVFRDEHEIPAALAVPLLAIGSCIVFVWYKNLTALALGAVSLTIAAVYWPPLRGFLSNRLSVWLGDISFPLYLIHGPIMMIVGAPLMQHYGTGSLSSFAVQSVTVALSLLCAVLFRPVDRLATSVSRYVGQLAVRKGGWRGTAPAD